MASFRRLVSAFVLVVGSTSSAEVSNATVFSIGDLHGDFDRFQLILQSLGLASFDEEGKATWTGSRNVLVSTGDTVDRGDHSRAIFTAFRALAEGAEEDGGEVVNVMGNHDLMNLQGDMRYVPRSEFSPDGDFGGKTNRNFEWSTKGPIGQDVRSRFVTAAVRGNSVFVHAGLHPMWLQNRGDQDPVEALNAEVRVLLQAETVGREELFGPNGPFWIRDFAMKPEAKICELVDQTLKLAGAKRMVLGHTIQDDGVTGRCPSANGPRVVLADTAISRAYGPHGKPSAVEYLPDGSVTAIYFDDFGNQSRHVLHNSFGNSSPSSEL